jgi:hypothetical protein
MSPVYRTLGKGNPVSPGGDNDTPGTGPSRKDGKVIYLLVVAAVVVAAPVAAAVLVTVASLREDAAHSLARRPPSWLAAAARRLLALRTDANADESGPLGAPLADGLLDDHGDLEMPPPHSDWADQMLTRPRS